MKYGTKVEISPYYQPFKHKKKYKVNDTGKNTNILWCWAVQLNIKPSLLTGFNPVIRKFSPLKESHQITQVTPPFPNPVSDIQYILDLIKAMFYIQESRRCLLPGEGASNVNLIGDI